MKLVALCLPVLGLVIGAAVSCSISRRSNDFACTTKANCASGRDCVDGFCVQPSLDAGIADGSSPDSVPGIDAESCPFPCTDCDPAHRSCTIECDSGTANCNEPVACPLGWSCNVNCSLDSSCRNVSCGGSTSCNITCSGRRSCRNLTCATTGTCTVTCSGDNSCDGARCGTGTCNVACTGLGSCPAVGCSLGDCTIGCTETDSCANVTCGTGACNVRCSGDSSCGQVDCGLSCACEVDCQFGSPCDTVTCRPGCDNNDPFGGCTSQPPNCNQCL